MNTGVEILLKRMETHPEDFDYRLNEGRPSRWMRLFDHAIGDEIATKEEREALEAGMKEVRRQRFTELVMKELAGVDETSEDPKSNPYLAPSATRLAGATLTSNGGTGLTWANRDPLNHALDAVKYQNEMMRRQLDADRVVLNKVEVRKKAVLR